MTDYEKLNDLIDEIDYLIESKATCDDPNFIKWQTKAKLFLSHHYGEKSDELKAFSMLKFWSGDFSGYSADSGYPTEFYPINACRDLERTKVIFSAYLEDMEENFIQAKPQNQEPNNFSKVFIVHGHDSELKSEVARLIEKQGIEVIILNEQTNGGKTIIEKLEKNSNVSGAVCLFTPDDVGNKAGENNMNPRARQNVVFEAGYFMGKLGRNRIVIIANKEMELPSDMSGVVYTNKQDWKIEMFKELKAMGYNIDLNKLF